MYGPLSQHSKVIKPRNWQKLPTEILALILEYAVEDYRIISAFYYTSVMFRKLVLNLERHDIATDLANYMTYTQYQKPQIKCKNLIVYLSSDSDRACKRLMYDLNYVECDNLIIETFKPIKYLYSTITQYNNNIKRKIIIVSNLLPKSIFKAYYNDKSKFPNITQVRNHEYVGQQGVIVPKAFIMSFDNSKINFYAKNVDEFMKQYYM